MQFGISVVTGTPQNSRMPFSTSAAPSGEFSSALAQSVASKSDEKDMSDEAARQQTNSSVSSESAQTDATEHSTSASGESHPKSAGIGASQAVNTADTSKRASDLVSVRLNRGRQKSNSTSSTVGTETKSQLKPTEDPTASSKASTGVASITPFENAAAAGQQIGAAIEMRSIGAIVGSQQVSANVAISDKSAGLLGSRGQLDSAEGAQPGTGTVNSGSNHIASSPSIAIADSTSRIVSDLPAALAQGSLKNTAIQGMAAQPTRLSEANATSGPVQAIVAGSTPVAPKMDPEIPEPPAVSSAAAASDPIPSSGTTPAESQSPTAISRANASSGPEAASRGLYGSGTPAGARASDDRKGIQQAVAAPDDSIGSRRGEASSSVYLAEAGVDIDSAEFGSSLVGTKISESNFNGSKAGETNVSGASATRTSDQTQETGERSSVPHASLTGLAVESKEPSTQARATSASRENVTNGANLAVHSKGIAESPTKNRSDGVAVSAPDSKESATESTNSITGNAHSADEGQLPTIGVGSFVESTSDVYASSDLANVSSANVAPNNGNDHVPSHDATGDGNLPKGTGLSAAQLSSDQTASPPVAASAGGWSATEASVVPATNAANVVASTTTENHGAVDGLPPAHQMLDSTPVNGSDPATQASAARLSAETSSAVQMRMGIHTSAFGNVEVHTIIEQSQVGVAIRGDHEVARWFNSEMGGLETGLKNQHLNLTGVSFSTARSGVQTATSFQNGQPRQQQQNSRPEYAQQGNNSPQPESAIKVDSVASQAVELVQTRVSILV